MWARRRAPRLVGLLVGGLVAAGLWLAGAPVTVVAVVGVLIGASAGALVSLFAEGLSADDIGRNKLEPGPDDAARLAYVEDAASQLP